MRLREGGLLANGRDSTNIEETLVGAIPIIVLREGGEQRAGTDAIGRRVSMTVSAERGRKREKDCTGPGAMMSTVPGGGPGG
jgi:hypothetical protein